jgi:hypothetical protein
VAVTRPEQETIICQDYRLSVVIACTVDDLERAHAAR